MSCRQSSGTKPGDCIAKNDPVPQSSLFQRTTCRPELYQQDAWSTPNWFIRNLCEIRLEPEHGGEVNQTLRVRTFAV